MRLLRLVLPIKMSREFKFWLLLLEPPKFVPVGAQVAVGAAASCVAARVSLLMALMILAFELVLCTNFAPFAALFL